MLKVMVNELEVNRALVKQFSLYRNFVHIFPLDWSFSNLCEELREETILYQQ